VRVCNISYAALKSREPHYTFFCVACLALPYFPYYLINGTTPGKKSIKCVCDFFFLKGVPLATEPGIPLIILPLMRILQRNLERTTDTFLFISHTTNVLLFKFRCIVFIGIRIIKEMSGSVASGTPCIPPLFLTQRTYSSSNFVTMSSLVLELLNFRHLMSTIVDVPYC
jgi:hypothetical protein